MNLTDNDASPYSGTNRQRSRGRRIFLLGLVYACVSIIPAWVFGWNNVALLFPSAGIAFGALLIFGVYLWPGIVFGCLLEGLFHASLINAWVWMNWLNLFANTLATLLSALFGYWLMRRFVNLRQILRGTRRSILFVCLVAPIAYAFGTVFLLFLHWSSTLFNMEESLRVLFMWWVGDTMGVLTLTPILLIFFSQQNRYKWQNRARIIFPALVLIALYFTLFANILGWEEQSKRTAFMHDSAIASALLQEHLQLQEEKLASVAQLLRVSPELSEQDWSDAVSDWVAKHPGSAGFGHTVLVAHNERVAFEGKMQKQGLPAFAIREIAPDGSMLPARDASDYLPYMHVTPANPDFIGINAYNGSEQDVWLDTILFGKPTLAASGALPWLPADSEQKSVMLLQAIAGENNRLRGIVISGLHMDDLVKASVGTEHLSTMTLCLTAESAKGEWERLFGEAGCETPEWETQKKDLPLYRSTLRFGGQQWEMRALPVAFLQEPYFYQARYYATPGDWESYLLACLLILILTFLFISYATRIQGKEASSRESIRLLRRARRDLRRQEKLMQFLQETTSVGYWEQSATGFRSSDNLCRMFGIVPNSLSHWRQLLVVMPAEEQSRFADAMNHLEKNDQNMTFDIRLDDPVPTKGQGTVIRFHIHSRIEKGRYILGVAEDVTQELQQAQQIQFLTYHDPITQLGNSLYWNKQASEAIAFAGKNSKTILAIFEIALENMDKLISAFGIAAGGMAQNEVAQRIQKMTHAGDIIAWHGRRFSCCLPNLESASEALCFARDLLEAVKSVPLMFGEREIMLSISIGIAFFPEDGHTLDALQKNAATALRALRTVNPGHFQFFDPDMNQHSVEQLMLESALRLGIPRNELVLHYQPQIHLGKKVQSCEALVRWMHPVEGMIPPAQFIPLAEETGLILALGQWVFAEACRQQVRWQEYEIPIAVNISGVQFRWDSFVDGIIHILTDTGANPKQIELEITESALMNLNDTLLERIYTLKNIGFSFSLDDFGTGYSSLSYLKRLPITTLKLDRSFIMDLPHDADSCSITTAALLMAKELGMTVVAEGVENKAQLAFLQQHGCDILQGYYFSKPLDVPAFEQWLRTFRIQESDS